MDGGGSNAELEWQPGLGPRRTSPIKLEPSARCFSTLADQFVEVRGGEPNAAVGGWAAKGLPKASRGPPEAHDTPSGCDNTAVI